jgi:hypothetical protein
MSSLAGILNDDSDSSNGSKQGFRRAGDNRKPKNWFFNSRTALNHDMQEMGLLFTTAAKK